MKIINFNMLVFIAVLCNEGTPPAIRLQILIKARFQGIAPKTTRKRS